VNMMMHRSGTGPTVRPGEAGFTGEVRVSGYFRRPSPSRLAGAEVEFAPGARTPWKTSAVGQTIVVTQGVGRAQSHGEPVSEIRSGDVLWFAPGTRHWEGAALDGPMTYIALQENHDGSDVEFGAAVMNAEYRSGGGA